MTTLPSTIFVVSECVPVLADAVTNHKRQVLSGSHSAVSGAYESVTIKLYSAFQLCTLAHESSVTCTLTRTHTHWQKHILHIRCHECVRGRYRRVGDTRKYRVRFCGSRYTICRRRCRRRRYWLACEVVCRSYECATRVSDNVDTIGLLHGLTWIRTHRKSLSTR